MRSIAIMNQKGGVGKTTTAVNLCAALAATGLRGCLLDLDPQAHATLHFGIEPRPDELSIYDVLTGKTRIGEVCRQVAENLWLVPSSLDLAAAELELVERDRPRGDPPRQAPRRPAAGRLPVHRLPAVAGHPDAQRVGGGRARCSSPCSRTFFALHGLSKLLETIDLVAGAAQRQAEAQRRDPLHVRRQHAAGGRGGPGRGRFLPQRPRASRPPGPTPRPSRRGFAATSAWPRPPVSASRSSSTPPTRTAPRTTNAWPKKLRANEGRR